MFKFLRKKSPEMKLHYEEKKYSFGVIVLVVLFTVLLVSLGERALADLREGIPFVEYPYREIQELPAEQAFRNFQENTLSQLQNRKWELESQIRVTRKEYDTSLLENIAGENERLYGDEGTIREDFGDASRELAEVNALLKDAQEESQRLSKAAEEAREPVLEAYKWKVRIRQAKIFAWEALFWIPFFLLTLFWYSRSRREESKWEIVSLSALIAASVLAIQSTTVVIWSWIPREFLRWLWEVLRATILTRIVGYYLMIIAIILVFGWVIVFVHRRMTDPVRGGKKKIREKRCPTCGYPLILSETYCGGCGKELKKKCASCGKEGYAWQAACVYCGKK